MAIATLTMLCSCEVNPEVEERRHDEAVERITTGISEDMYNVDFDGHTYVVLLRVVAGGSVATMVHSPNCECKQNKSDGHEGKRID